ncbi:TonB-dependent receptor [Parasulfuritortus cantonensis]|nr:TonB-dependent receptor [Parasulfuritortus cantonensis]
MSNSSHCLATGLLAGVMVSAAAVAADDTAVLPEVVVSATRTEKTVDEAPGFNAVVGRGELEQRSLESLDEAVNEVPGVYVRRGKGLMDTLSSISMHGIPDGSRSLVLLDGAVLNDAYTGAVAYGGLPAEFLTRVEVAEGPASALYGGNAMGGVTQFVTRLPDKTEFQAKLGFGDAFKDGEALANMRRLVLTGGTRLDNGLRLFAGLSGQSSDGFPTDMVTSTTAPAAGLSGYQTITDTKGSLRYLYGDKGDNGWSDRNALVKAEMPLADGTRLRASWLGTRYRYDYDDAHAYASNALGDAVYYPSEASYAGGQGGHERNLWQAGLERPLAGGVVNVGLTYNDIGKSWYVTPGSTSATTLDGGPGTYSGTASHYVSADLQWTRDAGLAHTVTVGTTLRRDQADNEEYLLADWTDEDARGAIKYRAGGVSRNAALFVQDEWRLAPDLTAYLGVRGDWWRISDGYAEQFTAPAFSERYASRSASAVSPKASLVWKARPDLVVKLSAGKAFRPPTAYDLYRTWKSSSGTTFAGNPELEPERLTSWDLGAETSPWRGGLVRLDYFENYMSDLIYSTGSCSGSGCIRPKENVGKAFGRGVIVAVEQQFGAALHLFANATFNDAEITENSANPALEGKDLQHLPKTMLNLGVSGRHGAWDYYLARRYASKRYGTDDNSDVVSGVPGAFDAYAVVDARVGYRLTKNARVALSIDNLLDREYYASYRAPGRSWLVELGLEW